MTASRLPWAQLVASAFGERDAVKLKALRKATVKAAEEACRAAGVTARSRRGGA